MALFNQDINIQGKIVSTNPVFTEEQQLSNPLLKKFAKSGRKTKTEQVEKPQVSNEGGQPKVKPSNSNPNQNSPSMTSHPLSNNPFFRMAIDRLCPNLVNLLDPPGKLELKPYWKEALFKKSAFEGC